MNREVGRFLLESWQLFYWSLFLPSKLQQRMNEWSPQKTEKGEPQDTSSWDILSSNSRYFCQYLLASAILSFPLKLSVFLPSKLQQRMNEWSSQKIGKGEPQDTFSWDILYSNSRYFCQYLLASAILSLPLELSIFLSGKRWDWMLLLSASSIIWGFLISYSFQACQSPGLGFCSFLLMALINWQSHFFEENWQSFLQYQFKQLLSVCQITLPSLSHLFVVAVSIIVFVAICLAIGLAKIAAEIAGIVVLLIVEVSPLWIILYSLMFALLNIATVLLMGAFLHLPWFLLACALIAVGSAPLRPGWFGIIWIAFFVLFGLDNLGLNALWAVPVAAVSYYRIFPDYLLSCLSSLVFRSMGRFSRNPASLLTKLPPYTTEFLWLPLPNHARILADTFRENGNTDFGMATLQKMQAISLPGFKLTIRKALPLIVANRFAAVNTTTKLIDSVAPTHPILPLIIPAFYQSDENGEFLASPKSRNSEINIFFPFFKGIANDTAAALKAGSSALQQRGLERLVDKLKMLQIQLPGFGLKPQSVKRWQPAIERWQEILELEIAEQQKTSQGELLNPFQFGNPLRPDRAAIFKGRQDFADRLVRSILDRNRPTLVLHGPRRAGKTSFLLNLPRLLPSDLVPIYLDMQQGSMTASEGDFCYGLVRAIDRDTRSQGLQLPPIPSRQDFATQPYPTLEDWLDLALPKLGERRLLLNLDEFEKIGSAIKDGRISERLFDQLRSMIQHYDRLGFLFSGVQTLEELGPRWSNYFISVVPMEMHYLESHEAEDLLLHPDPEFTLRYDTGIIAEILRLTRCQPYLLQLIGSAIVNQANLQHTQLATTTLLQAAIQAAFTNGEPYFTNIWTEFTGTTPAEVTAGQQFLIALAQGNTHIETIDESTTARRRLLRYHVIERDGDIDKIEIPLFEQWVRERSIGT
jgi:hypothetical protein